ncbi:protein argonaute 18-like isoform X2 [Ipomoea triloba]|uniref:protein argonaute 18-like isoform X2 n=1 Tax=Ipomoea triloba TaxID=35885 RepID=UPI00125CF801|nr:protein argonaute 18-like isoform X2 [Ipomoea triloba]
MDRYQKVEKQKPESAINENEIRITSQGLVRNYINYATTLLQERCGKDILLKAMGQAISKTVAITELIKRRFPGLHQHTSISSVSITDVWEPIEEGLQMYQAPSHVEQGKRYNNYQSQQPPRQLRPVYGGGNEDSYGRGRGHGRGRGQGWNRGGYGNYQGNYRGNYQGNYQGNNHESYQENYQWNYQGNYQENVGYSNWGRGGSHGGWGYHGSGYGGGGGGGGRAYGRGGSRGRIGNRGPRGGGNQA